MKCSLMTCEVANTFPVLARDPNVTDVFADWGAFTTILFRYPIQTNGQGRSDS